MRDITSSRRRRRTSDRRSRAAACSGSSPASSAAARGCFRRSSAGWRRPTISSALRASISCTRGSLHPPRRRGVWARSCSTCSTSGSPRRPIRRFASPTRSMTSRGGEPLWAAGLGATLDDLLREIELIADGLRMVRERLETDTRRAEELAPLLNELSGVSRRLANASDALRSALRPGVEASKRVRGIEAVGGAREAGTESRNVSVASVPLDLAPILREDLFRRVETCVVTSATLAVGDGFAFIEGRLGLDQNDVEPVTAVLPSPFDYARQAVLAIPSDFPAPNEDGPLHFRRTVQAGADLIEAAGGGVFLLFTSHRDVREAAQVLRALGAEGRWPLLVHGEASRDVLRSEEHTSELQ